MTQFNGQITVLREDGVTGRPIKWCTECLTIGSDESCDGCIYSDLIDAKHCELTLLGDDQAYLIHTGSKEFKTIVDGVEILEPCLLAHNAVFTVGQISFRFEYPQNSKWHPNSKEMNMPQVNPLSLRSKIFSHPVISTPKKNTYSIHCHKTNSPKISPIRSSNTKIKTVIPNQRLNIRPFVTPTQKKLINKSNRKSKLNLHLLKSEESRRHVSFGPNLSPEQFDKELPPKHPLKKGATPMKTRSSIANSLTEREAENSLIKKAYRQSKKFSIISNDKSMNSSDYSLFDKSSFVLSNDSTDFANDSFPTRNYRKSNKKNSNLFDKSSFALTETSNEVSTDSFAEINSRKSNQINTSPMNYADNHRKSLVSKSMDCYDYSIENENSIREDSSAIQKDYSLKRGRKSSSMINNESITEEISFNDSKIEESLNLENIKELENHQNKMAMIVNDEFTKGRKSIRKDKKDIHALSSLDEDKPKTKRTSSTPKQTRKSIAKTRQTMDLEGLDKLYDVEEDTNKSNSNKSKESDFVTTNEYINKLTSRKTRKTIGIDIVNYLSDTSDSNEINLKKHFNAKRFSAVTKSTKSLRSKKSVGNIINYLSDTSEHTEIPNVLASIESSTRKSNEIPKSRKTRFSVVKKSNLSESESAYENESFLISRKSDAVNKINIADVYENILLFEDPNRKSDFALGEVSSMIELDEIHDRKEMSFMETRKSSNSNKVTSRKSCSIEDMNLSGKVENIMLFSKFNGFRKSTKSPVTRKSIINIPPRKVRSEGGEKYESEPISIKNSNDLSISNEKTIERMDEEENMNQNDHEVQNKLLNAHPVRKTEKLHTTRNSNVPHKRTCFSDGEEIQINNTRKSSKKYEVRKSNQNSRLRKSDVTGLLADTYANEDIVETSIMIEGDKVYESDEISLIETPKSLRSNKKSIRSSISVDDTELLEKMVQKNKSSKFWRFRQSTKSPVTRKSTYNVIHKKGKSVGGDVLESEFNSTKKFKDVSVSDEETVENPMDRGEHVDQSVHEVPSKRLNVRGIRKTEQISTIRKSIVPDVERECLSEGEEIKETEIISFHDLPKSKSTDKSTRPSVRISKKSDTVECIESSNTEDLQISYENNTTNNRLESDKIQTRKSIESEEKVLTDYEDVLNNSPLKINDSRKSNKSQISRKSTVEDVNTSMVVENINSRKSSKLRNSNINKTNRKSAIDHIVSPQRDLVVVTESSHILDSIKLNELRKSNGSNISNKSMVVSKDTEELEINEKDLVELEVMSPKSKKSKKSAVKRKYKKNQSEPVLEVQSDNDKNDKEFISTSVSVLQLSRKISKITNLPAITIEKPVQGLRTRRGNKKTDIESEETILEDVNLSEMVTKKPVQVQRTRRGNKKAEIETEEPISKKVTQENLDLQQNENENEQKVTNKMVKTRSTLKRNVKHLDDESSSVATVESRVTRMKSKVISKKEFKEPVSKKSRIIENEIVEETVEGIDNSSIRSSRSTRKRVLEESASETIAQRKVTRGQPKTKIMEEEQTHEVSVVENFVKPKTTRGRPKAKAGDDEDKNSVITSNSSVAPIKLLKENDSENIKLKNTRGRQIKKKVINIVEKDSIEVVSKSNEETVSENFVQPKRTRGRPKAQVVESLVDKAYDEAVPIASITQENVAKPRSTRGRRKAQEINSSVQGDASEIDFPTNAKRNKSKKIDDLPIHNDVESENLKENSAPKEYKRAGRSAKAKTSNVQFETVSAKKGMRILNEISNTDKLKLDSNEVISLVRTRSRRGKL